MSVTRHLTFWVRSKWIILLLVLFCGVLPGGCNLLNTSEDPSIRETQLELNVQQTLTAKRATDKANSPNTPDNNATQEAMSAEQTRAALQAQPTIDPVIDQRSTQESEQATQAAAEVNTPEPTEEFDISTRIKTTNILLYEDMIGQADTNRYVKDTLESMGVVCEQDGSTPCKDVGSAKGWLEADITGMAPNGEPWELVILAVENKQGASERKSQFPGEFFDYVLDLIEKGIPVILETGNLDQYHSGAARELMARCGIEFENNWIKVPPARMVMFPIDPSHPILQEPNSNLSFTNVTSYWTTTSKTFYYDLGDLVQLSRGSEARLLLGTIAAETTTHGTLTVCLNNHLILQTFSSHQLAFDNMKLVWENYIYFMLKGKFLGFN